MSNLSLLIVEDELELIGYCYEVASDFFHSIYVASTLSEAITFISNKKIDCILLDNYLPDGEGGSIFDLAKINPSYYPTVMMTAAPTIDVATKALKNRVIELCSKPIRLQMLKSVLELLRNEAGKIERELKMRSRNEFTLNTARQLARMHQLTEREVDVIKSSLFVKTNKELADKLFISQGTVKRHWHNIFNKTNLRSKDDILQLVSNVNVSLYKTSQNISILSQSL